MLGTSIENTCLRLTKYVPYTVKKGLRFSRPQPGCHLPNSSWPRIIQFFPATESLVSDIPAGDGKTANLFLQCTVTATFQDPCHGPRTENPSDEVKKCRPPLDPRRVCRPPRISIFCLPKKIIIDVCKEIVNWPFLDSSIAYEIFTTKR
jgi:hypothetical protein